jgi:uncharacterized repeat protein (TIGR01451 family)
MAVRGRAFRYLAAILNVALLASLALVGLAGTATTASAQGLEPLSASKQFTPGVIPVNGTSTLTLKITNPATHDATQVLLVDPLPSALAVSSGATNSCGGTVGTSTTGGQTTVALSGGTVPASSSCQFSLSVIGLTAGDWTNTTEAVKSQEDGPGNTAQATLAVVGPPKISKAFGAAFIRPDGETSLTFTVTNPSTTTALSGVDAQDTFPSGLVVASPNGATNSCGGTLTAPVPFPFAPDIELTGGTLPAGGSCSFAVNVKGGAPGLQHNTVTVQSTESGPALAGQGSADIEIVAPASISKAFGAASKPLNGTTTLTFTITNPNSVTALTGIGFTDPLPSGLEVGTPNGLTNGCGGSATATEGTGTISLSGATVGANASCTLTVNVNGSSLGVKNNVTDLVTSTEAGSGNQASATITVGDPPSITKAFGASEIPLNGTTSLKFTITNPNAASLPGIGFTDNLPSGLVVSSPNGMANGCGGSATATQGTGTISLSGVSVGANTSCTLTVNVTGTTAGVKNNTSAAVTSTATGTGNTASASLTVVAPPSISKAFGAASIPLNGTTSLTFTITNPNSTVALSDVDAADQLPSGLVVATPNGLTGSCGAGTLTATAGSDTVALSGGTLAAGGSCSFAVNVTGTTAGVKDNTAPVGSRAFGLGNTASASLTVVAPPSISKAFGAASIPLNGSTSLTFTITNPAANTVALVGVGFGDNLPAGLAVANPPNLNNTCGGAATAVAGSGSVSLSGASVAVNSSCTLSVDVTGTTAGVQNNTSGVVASTNGGNGNTASASMTVVAPPSISKAFGAASIPLNGKTSLTFTITNPNSGTALSGVGFADTLPSGLEVASPNGLSTTCGGSSAATPGSGSVSLSGATLAASASCTFAVDVKGTSAGVKNNTSDPVTSTNGGNGNTSNASLTVVAPPSISKAFGAASIAVNGSTSLTFTISNPNGTAALSGVGFSDSLPSGLAVANPNGLSNTCGGAATAVAGSSSVSLSGASLAAGGSCTFAVNVTGTATGLKNNTSGAVSSTEGGNGNTTSANVTVGYNVLGFFSPLPKDTYNAGATIPVKFALADVNGARIPDAEAQAIASSCRAKVRLDSGAPGCAAYNPTTKTFQFNLNTAKNLSKGIHTVTLDVFVGANVVSTKSTTTTIK